jgi:hypothetical protein
MVSLIPESISGDVRGAIGEIPVLLEKAVPELPCPLEPGEHVGLIGGAYGQPDLLVFGETDFPKRLENAALINGLNLGHVVPHCTASGISSLCSGASIVYSAERERSI